jgi:hypothetical protein
VWCALVLRLSLSVNSVRLWLAGSPSGGSVNKQSLSIKAGSNSVSKKEWMENMMPYVRKYLRILHGYFHRLGIFNIKFILMIQNCMKSNREKFLKYFSNIGYHVTSHLAKFELKTQLVYRETKKRNPITW